MSDYIMIEHLTNDGLQLVIFLVPNKNMQVKSYRQSERRTCAQNFQNQFLFLDFPPMAAVVQ
jgi:hypothetical protein